MANAAAGSSISLLIKDLLPNILGGYKIVYNRGSEFKRLFGQLAWMPVRPYEGCG
jgi:hypothetical protein